MCNAWKKYRFPIFWKFTRGGHVDCETLITNAFHIHFYKRIFALHFQVIHVIPIHVITEEVVWCFTRFICASVHELTEEQDATVRANILIIFIENRIQILDT